MLNRYFSVCVPCKSVIRLVIFRWVMRYLSVALMVGISLLEFIGIAAPYDSLPENLPDIPWQLTVRPWQPIRVDKDDYLERIEGIVENYCNYQNVNSGSTHYGAIIDPFANREVQYSTPYFAMAAGTLLESQWGTAEQRDKWLTHGALAMDRATADLANDNAADDHAEFYVAAVSYAMEMYESMVSASRYQTWKSNLSVPNSVFLKNLPHNWRTYAMKGEWLRYKMGLVPREWAIDYIDQYWSDPSLSLGRSTYQRERLIVDDWHQYHDRLENPPPETFAYDAAARCNLLAMVLEGYDGQYRQDMFNLLLPPADISLCFMDPTGQAAATGRSGNHVWNDVVYGNLFERLSEYYHKAGNLDKAGQFRRAAMLTMQSTDRFRQPSGIYSVTKNQYSASDRTWFATYSYLTNYNGYTMFHMSESARARQNEIAEQPVPAEIGGYIVNTGSRHSQTFANAGGMQLQAGTHGMVGNLFGQYWSTLGVLRFSRMGWDSRLGPGDGCRESSSGKGVSFAPAFKENGNWIQLADVPDRYEGVVTSHSAHPLLTRLTIEWQPRAGYSGPVFQHDLTVTPDGVMSVLQRTSGTAEWAQTWPVLEYDGASTLVREVTDHSVSIHFPDRGDRQNYICLNDLPIFNETQDSRLSGYGVLKPFMVQGQTESEAIITFVYPSKAGEPSAAAVYESMQLIDPSNFESILARVQDDFYEGNFAGGGTGNRADLDRDGSDDVSFASPCEFVAKHKDVELIALETDLDTSATYRGQSYTLSAHTPLILRPGPFRTDIDLPNATGQFQTRFTVTPKASNMEGSITCFQRDQYTADAPAPLMIVFEQNGLVRVLGANGEPLARSIPYEKDRPVSFRIVGNLTAQTLTVFAYTSENYAILADKLTFSENLETLNTLRTESLDACLEVSAISTENSPTEITKINFQPDGAAVPVDYLTDFGSVYGARENGLTYGWSADNTDTMRDRFRLSDQRYDTLAHMQLNGDVFWEIELPNGTYSVKMVVGDPAYYDSRIHILAEAVTVVSATSTSTTRQFSGEADITVTDGKLTISNASDADNNKICFIEITSLSITTDPADSFGIQTNPL